MALSFADSIKNNTESTPMELKASIIENSSLMTLEEEHGIEVYSDDSGNWQQHTGYVRYQSFSDDDISIINDNKDIVETPSQEETTDNDDNINGGLEDPVENPEQEW